MAEIPTGLTFVLKRELVEKMRLAVLALCDSEFNLEGLGVLNCTEDAFQITVDNANTGVTGNLYFGSSSLIDFRFSHPILNMSIDLRKLQLFLENVEDSIFVYHLRNSVTLEFICGYGASEILSLDLVQSEIEPTQLPLNNVLFEQIMDAEFLLCLIEKIGLRYAKQLEEFLRRLEQIENELVQIKTKAEDDSDQLLQIRRRVLEEEKQLEIRPQPVSVHLSEQHCVYCQLLPLPLLPRQNSTDVVTPGKECHAVFTLQHLLFLKKVLVLATRFRLSFLNVPSTSMMLRFNIGSNSSFTVLQRIQKAVVKDLVDYEPVAGRGIGRALECATIKSWWDAETRV